MKGERNRMYKGREIWYSDKEADCMRKRVKRDLVKKDRKEERERVRKREREREKERERENKTNW
jgi:hypothetical protein